MSSECCCCSFRTSVKILAVLSILGGIIQTIRSIMALTGLSEAWLLIEKFHDDCKRGENLRFTSTCKHYDVLKNSLTVGTVVTIYLLIRSLINIPLGFILLKAVAEESTCKCFLWIKSQIVLLAIDVVVIATCYVLLGTGIDLVVLVVGIMILIQGITISSVRAYQVQISVLDPSQHPSDNQI